MNASCHAAAVFREDENQKVSAKEKEEDFFLLFCLSCLSKQSVNCQNRKSEKSQNYNSILSQSTLIELNITIKKIIIILGPSLTRKFPSTVT